ncbi:hypothetical protein ACRAWD_20635 [Caulobacter segnis]
MILNLPDIDGFKILEALRQYWRGEAILVSGFATRLSSSAPERPALTRYSASQRSDARSSRR